MTLIVTNDFNNISFHDSSIEKIDRIGSDTILYISGGCLCHNHILAKQIDWRILEAILRIKNVISENSLEWIDTKEPKPHPNPSFPIDEIMDSKFNGNEFYFNGFLERSPWYEWYIESREFELNILKMKILEPGTE